MLADKLDRFFSSRRFVDIWNGNNGHGWKVWSVVGIFVMRRACMGGSAGGTCGEVVVPSI
jgi:hypothetical protein